MFQSYNKLTILDIDEDLDGLVGKKYPGSTGGEIFNYYGTDVDANKASNKYTTARGLKNEVSANYGFASGYNNRVTSSVIGGSRADASHAFGKDNTLIGGGSGGTVIAVGNSNKSQDAWGVMVGFSNELMDGFTSGGVVFGRGNKTYANVVVGEDNSEPTDSRSYSSVILGRNCSIKNASYTLYCGWGLTTPTNSSSVCLFGKHNELTYSLNNPSVIFGCGTGANNRKNALECNGTTVKIVQNLQLKTDTTEVNAITPALSIPASIDDKTLVTKSHLGATLPMTHLSGAITGLDESSFPLDFTSYWAAARATDANMKISLRINGSCYSKSLYNCLAVDGSFECYRSSYDSGTQVTTFSRYRFGWDYANKTLTLTGSMSWEMTDAGVISNVTHGLTGLVITIYQIETY